MDLAERHGDEYLDEGKQLLRRVRRTVTVVAAVAVASLVVIAVLVAVAVLR